MIGEGLRKMDFVIYLLEIPSIYLKSLRSLCLSLPLLLEKFVMHVAVNPVLNERNQAIEVNCDFSILSVRHVIIRGR